MMPKYVWCPCIFRGESLCGRYQMREFVIRGFLRLGAKHVKTYTHTSIYVLKGERYGVGVVDRLRMGQMSYPKYLTNTRFQWAIVYVGKQKKADVDTPEKAWKFFEEFMNECTRSDRPTEEAEPRR
jgi:hypothetical protein